ncbi:NFACT RNA binding domain-containing protein [Desulfoplanes formicivorans]|uniref:Fibronectin-binding protein n=1 Tax=Desulfoplanes formicivorans TaxID=1592317 RepID=A0A194AE81_9BACT|nr:NFACT RNA binding domain-containing protein [Desulfoplanes formicivorans]GAU07431.1 fibronectin-binding protein [Desulfoplanes formicivorans]
MEANFFRYAARELAPRITGMRIEKIFDPARGILTIDLGSPGYLILHASPSRGFFFLSSTKPDNKQQPSGQVMWLRKRTRSRRIRQVLVDWPSRRMAWLLGSRPSMYLLLDLRKGVSLVSELDPHFGQEPDWPDVEAIGSHERIWETYPQITPPVRHRLQHMGNKDAREFLERLRKAVPPSSYWILGDPKTARLSLWPDGFPKGRAFKTALAAAESYGTYVVAGMINGDREQKRIVTKRLRHLKKALGRIQRDRARLEAMVAGKELGRLLQAHLYHVDGSARLDTVCLDDGNGKTVRLDLDPSLTVRENMTRFFTRARKGERGLPLVEARKQVLVREMEQVQRTASMTGESARPAAQRVAGPAPGIPKKYRSLAVNLYRTSDGFLLIRGRNQKANHHLLSQLAGSQDLWFHAQDGPGAHVILKRDFSTQEVPRTSLEQAAIIAALSSWQKNAAKAQVMCALVKNVRKIKGAALGQVLVDQVEESLMVDMDASLEERLRIRP